MKLKQCILIKNECYKAYNMAKMTGIVVHDTAGGNVNLKRYVQPIKGQEHYAEIITDLGTNKNGNHWNQGKAEGWTRQACVHAFIGKNEDGDIETYQTLPYDICCWGVGSGYKGSYNFSPNARIQFEICDDGYKSEAYFYKAMKEAQEYCAYLCKQFGWNSDKICCHYEAYQRGYGGNHSDITIWLKTFGKDMNWFRAEVQKILDSKEEPTKESEDIDMTKDELIAIVDERISASKERVYHYWSEIESDVSWAYKPLKALYEKGIFKGASASDLCLTKTEIKALCWDARVMKDAGNLEY